MGEFRGWSKIPRLRRDVIITEKIDGTNACVWIGEDGDFHAQSRTRIITPESDNFGFAAWVHDNIEALRKLGPGYHYGEWWGHGIQRGYDLPKGERRFSLFNTLRYDSWDIASLRLDLPAIRLVPVLYHGRLGSWVPMEDTLHDLRVYGSFAAHGFARPEGIVLYHVAARQSFKVLLENDDVPKGEG
jgi:hypothetical protein